MLLALAAAAALSSCRIDHARYALRTDPNLTAEFRVVDSGPDWPGGLALRIHFARTGHSYWFLPFEGGTDDLQHLASTAPVDGLGWRAPHPDGGPRPLGELTFIGVDARYGGIQQAPHRGGIAPAHMLIPELGDRTWHAGRDATSEQFFDLAGC